MKRMSTLILTLFMNMVCIQVLAQQTSLVIDNQTPGWLSSKIDYADQLSVENLKVTGYINTDDICFLEQLSKKRSLQVLDLEDVHMAPGGTSLVAEIREGIHDDDMIDDYVYTGLELRKLITSKHVTHYNKLGLNNRIPSHKIDTLIIKEVSTEFYISGAPPARMLVVFPEGVERLEFTYGLIDSSFHLPSTLQKLIGYSIYSNINKVNITSFHEDPSNIVIESCNSQTSNKLKGDTLWIPAGTREKYLNTDFKNMRVIIEMTPPNAIEIREGDERCQRKEVFTNDTFILNADLIPQDAYYKGIIWKTSNPNIAEVDQNGKVTAVGYGNAQVIVCSDKDENIADTCDIVVYDHTTGISIAETSKDLNIGESFYLSANTLPTGTSNNQFTWSSSNEEIAIVESDGKVTGLKLGSCVIVATATDGGSKAECAVTVVQPAKEISLNKHVTSIKVDEQEELHATISPESTTNKSITWISRDDAIAEVSSLGIVKGKKAGKVFVVAQATSNAEVMDSCEITVLQPVTGVSISESSITLSSLGSTKQLTATVLPDDASDKSVSWESSNTAVCKVSGNGFVVAVGVGTSVITVTTIDGGFMAVCVATVSESDGIIAIEFDALTGSELIFDAQGKRLDSLQPGLNIIRMGDGTIKKVMMK